MTTQKTLWIGALLAAVTLVSTAARAADGYTEKLPEKIERVWIAPEFWANRLHDWRLTGGRIECVAGMPMRTVHLLTHRLGGDGDAFEVVVDTGVVEGGTPAKTSTGVLLGVGGDKMDYRGAAIVHQNFGRGGGIYVGVDGAGRAFIVDNEKKPGKVKPAEQGANLPKKVTLRISGETDGDKMHVKVVVAEGDRLVDSANATFPASRFVGNVALVSNGAGKTRFWFDDLNVKGSRIDADPKRRFGPIACAQHTLHHNGEHHVLKLTAQLMPVAESQPKVASLHIKGDDGWKKIAESNVIVPGWTAPFRIAEWDGTKDTPYRVIYGDAVWAGTIRKDPVDKSNLVVAGFTGNHNCGHGFGRPGYNYVERMWFPHADLVERVEMHKPDVLFFSGDQVYEGGSPTFPDRKNIKIDYMYKWLLWCWAYGDVARDIPTICIPDDHDVYQGNIWGEGGRRSPGRDHHGGYVHPADFVKMVERTQVSHLPDPYDPTPVGQGIGVYYSPWTYGRVSMAIIEDRKFKSGCARPEMPPTGTKRPDHVLSDAFAIETLDVDGLKLLGDRQLKFLHDWSADWGGADMKLVLSQTHFANMATHHGGGLRYLRADMDSNGWPQTGRNKAVDAIRRGFAFHLAGDQHLATLIRHGIDEHDDGHWGMTVPSIANFYPRAWAPKQKGKYSFPDPADYTGDQVDGFNNKVTVYAASNPGVDSGHEPKSLHNSMPGYGIIKVNRADRTYIAECWPRYAVPGKHDQYPGWPRTIKQIDNYGRKAAAHLPTIEVKGMTDPVVQVVDEGNESVVYTLRIQGTRFRPKVFARGKYTLVVGEPRGGKSVTLRGLSTEAADGDTLYIDLTD